MNLPPAALRVVGESGPLRLGEMLIERRLITAEDLERGLELQRERGDKLGKILVDLGFLAGRDMLAALSDQMAVPLVTIDQPPPASPEIDSLSSENAGLGFCGRQAVKLIEHLTRQAGVSDRAISD